MAGSRAALDRLASLRDGVLALAVQRQDPRLRVQAVIAAGHPPVLTASSLGRELVFIQSHTIHHQALMAIAAGLLGAPVPAGFGYAPSTPPPDVAMGPQ